MADEKNKAQDKKKGFFARFMEKLDKKMEEQAQKTSCCGGSGQDEGKGSSCC